MLGSPRLSAGRITIAHDTLFGGGGSLRAVTINMKTTMAVELLHGPCLVKVGQVHSVMLFAEIILQRAADYRGSHEATLVE